MKWYTTTRPNGDPGHRETIPGIQSYAAWVAIIVTIAGWGIFDRISLQRQIDAAAAAAFRDKAAERSELLNEIRVTVEDIIAAEPLVTRAEWTAQNDEVKHALAEHIMRTDRRLERIEDHSRHTLAVVEKLPAAKDE
jgi:hypothetical protein